MGLKNAARDKTGNAYLSLPKINLFLGSGGEFIMTLLYKEEKIIKLKKILSATFAALVRGNQSARIPRQMI